MDTFLPPKYSLNSFFVRHRAHPKRMKVIHGLNNAAICSVNDVGYTYFPSVDKKSQLAFPPNNFNQTLLSHRKQNQAPAGRNGLSLSDNEETYALEQQFVSKSQSSFSSANAAPPIKRKEKARPPQGMWNTFGLVDNSDQWRSELNALASSVGLITPHDIEEYRRKKEREEMVKELKEREKNKLPPATGANKPRQATGAHNNVTSTADQRGATGRLNEPLPTGRRTGTRASRGIGLTGKKYIVEQGEREAWMLQVLCQILQTDNLIDVQSWLVSANEPDKERVKHLIDQAMKGLEESGRIEVNNQQLGPIDENSSLKEIESTLGKLNLDKPVSRMNTNTNSNKSKRLHTSSSSSNKQQQHKADILKIEEDDEIGKLDGNRDNIKTPGTDQTGTVVSFSVNNLDKSKRSPLDSAVIKLETPRGDFKIEQVKVTLVVKDDQTNQIQEVVGDWAPPDEHQSAKQ